MGGNLAIMTITHIPQLSSGGEVKNMCVCYDV